MAHWKSMFDSDYLAAFMLDGKDLTLTIKSVKQEEVKNQDGDAEKRPILHFVENYKPMVVNKTNGDTIERIYNAPDTDDWIGKKITIYATKVKAFGKYQDALRIRLKKPVEQKEVKIFCEDCGGVVGGRGNMTTEQWAQYSKAKIGKVICSDCANLIRQTESEVKSDENNENQD